MPRRCRRRARAAAACGAGAGAGAREEALQALPSRAALQALPRRAALQALPRRAALGAALLAACVPSADAEGSEAGGAAGEAAALEPLGAAEVEAAGAAGAGAGAAGAAGAAEAASLEGAALSQGAEGAAEEVLDDFFADERMLLEYNRARRMQAINDAPLDFPTFLRDGFEATVVTPPDSNYVASKDGMLTLDFELGDGTRPGPNDEIVFNYTVYNEAGKKIDGTYKQNEPAQSVLGLGALIPGVEEGILGMNVGGRRRIVCPPELGPPVGPQTFFMSRQYEVFDVELLEVHKCRTERVLFTQREVCE